MKKPCAVNHNNHIHKNTRVLITNPQAKPLGLNGMKNRSMVRKYFREELHLQPEDLSLPGLLPSRLSGLRQVFCDQCH